MKTLGIFARRPEPGRTKTRLAASIGDVAAAQLAAAFARDLLQRCPSLADRLLLALTPTGQGTEDWFAPLMSGNCSLLFQPDGDLGQKLAWFFQTAFATGAQQVVLIGSDSPDLPDFLISNAFERLLEVDLVLSPALDGGYVLIGFRQNQPGLFEQIRWSSEHTLNDTLAAAAQAGLQVKLLDPWYDVDELDDLSLLCSLQSPDAGNIPAQSRIPEVLQGHEKLSAACPATQAALKANWAQIQQALSLR
jgi:uncharacterized protein